MPTQKAIEVSYQNVKSLVSAVAMRFLQKYKGDPQEILAEARLHFMRAYHSYEETGSEFTTWVQFKIWHGLLDTKRQQAINASRLKRVVKELTRLENPVKFDLDRFLFALSPDAAMAVRLALRPTSAMKWSIRMKSRKNNNPTQSLRTRLKAELRRRGWEQTRIDSAFKEVRDSLA